MFDYFDIEEFDCQETGENEMNYQFIHRLDRLREACGFPFVITSGYRSPNHSIEAAKSTPGQHTQGIAADIQVHSALRRRQLLSEAFKLGFSGVGVAKGFIHVDDRLGPPIVWCY